MIGTPFSLQVSELPSFYSTPRLESNQRSAD